MSYWTNASVLSFASGRDPVAAIQEEAQDLVLKALERGWSGPPYNPIEIAGLMGVSVTPSYDIPDARTIERQGKATIEFNPSQPRERVRFSIAHEVAHLLFSDALIEARHRGGTGSRPDEWQLEMLCNIAAAEFVMPIGSLDLGSPLPSIEQLMFERRRYDVSTEAFMIRLVKSSDDPIGIICASPSERPNGRTYRVDYFIGSPTSPRPRLVGKTLPNTSAAYRCTAIGYTDKAAETWVTGAPLLIEYVGIPGYPGSSLPRTIGLIRFGEAALGHTAIRYVHGNVLEPRGKGEKIICQLVNDRALSWGGGTARQAAKRYPAAEADYTAWLMSIPTKERLGKVHFFTVSKEVTIASIVAQSGFGPSQAPRIKYIALETALAIVSERATERGCTVHLPRIGTGAARANWPTVVEMIEQAFTGVGIDVTVYDLPPKREQLNLF